MIKDYFTVEPFSTINKSHSDFVWAVGQSPYFQDEPDFWKKVMGRGKFAYCVMLYGTRKSKYFLDKKAAQRMADKMNGRQK